MVTRQTRRPLAQRAFSLIELLVVIAIIAILAAILFPAFAAAREQSRQAGTLSNMHAVYVGARLFAEDEGHYPSVLFGYAEAPISPAPAAPNPAQHPATLADVNPVLNITAMDQSQQYFTTNAGTNFQGLNRGYLYPEQVKDYIAFTCSDNLIKDKRQVTQVFYPHNSLYKPDQIVTWEATAAGACPNIGDRDLPDASYVGKPKLYYLMDSMDIGPRLDANGNVLFASPGIPQYELHYSPDWTRKIGAGCEPADATNNGKIDITQLKYKNLPADRTILTYVTDHVATAGSSKVMIILLNGTARKMDVQLAAKQLPLNYKP